MLLLRDVFGDCALVGDHRWAGTYGVSGDFIARDNCRQDRLEEGGAVFEQTELG